MDFTYPPEAEAFRAELSAWLEAHVTDEHRALSARGLGAATDDEWLAAMREWNRLLADAGYAAIAWPPEYGGRGAGIMEQVVWAEEMSRAGAPGTLNPIGISNIAPAIMEYGTEDQKRHLLPRMLRGDDIWCQGFSEPDAGSDLAALTTTAVRDGDHYVVNGQKVWTTLAHRADWCELLVRTDPEAPRHRGISCLLVDMTLPGIEVRPLVTITGEHEFNEIFFTDVRVPVSALLGPENEGWRVAMSTLQHERAGVAILYAGVGTRIRRLLELAHSTPVGPGTAADDDALRRKLARVFLHGEVLKLVSWRAISGALHGRTGPESSVVKLVWSETLQHLAQVAADVLGPAGTSGEWGWDQVAARGLSIAGGTTQVNKNILAERVLGLPRST